MIRNSIARAVSSLVTRPVNGAKLSFETVMKKLFANGEQGFFYDPNDLSTMFQDAAGTVPVTAVGQPVGLIKDKSGRNNHAFQTVSASRPLLGRHPVSGVRNLVKNSYDVSSSNWGRGDVTVTPVGLGINGNTCYNLNPTGGPLSWCGPNILSLPTGQTVTTSFYAKKGTGERSKIIFENMSFNWSNGRLAEFDLIAGTSNGVGTSIIPVRDGWYRCSITRTVGNTSATRAVFYVDVYGQGVTGNDVNLSDVQVEVSATATTYQTVHNVTDITEAGVTSTNYLYFDGVDDFLQTNNIDFTATDKVSLFAGVRKLSDASAGMLCELGPNVSTTAGTFFIAAPPKAAAQISAASNGTVARYADADNLTAPISTVISASSDITANTLIIRANGTQSMKNTISQGGGKYANYPLYIGRRNGASIPFNGHIYGLIGIGRLTTDNETAAIEKELAKRTGVTLNV